MAPSGSISAAAITGEAVLIAILATTLGVMLPPTTDIGTMATDIKVTRATRTAALRCQRFEMDH
ncbi:MAG: hypothetical protein ACREDV_06835 [Methylocella sp.]